MCNDQSFVEASTSISSPSSISMISAESYDFSDMNDFLFFYSNSSCDSDIGNGLDALSTTQHQSGLPTYKLVGDNIDKNIRPRDVRINSQTVSLHYYHSYALRDRIDLTSLEDSPSLPDMEGIRLENFLPTLQDEETIKGNFQHLIARALGDGGTLYQLRNLINCRNVVKKPMDDLAACEDFAITVVEAHIVSATMVIFDMKTADDRPCEKFFPTGCEKLDTVQRKKFLCWL